MKLKSKIRYYFFKLFPRRFSKAFTRLYDHKLNYNLLRLIENGIKIENIYDIGAYRGGWSKKLNEAALKNKNFFLFEANEENDEYLSKLNFEYFFEVLSDKSKSVEFYSNISSGDSYFKEQTVFYSNLANFKIKKTVTLDEIVSKEGLPKPDFLKIDTQGSELDILRGATRTVSECPLIYLECPVIEYNYNSPNFNEYIKFLDNIGFIPYDICEVHKADNVLTQVDILFIKKSKFKKIHLEKKILNILN